MDGWVWWVRKGGAGWRGGGAGLEGERERGVRSAMIPATPLSPDSTFWAPGALWGLRCKNIHRFRRWTDFGGGWRGEAGVAETMGMLKGSGAKGG